MSAEATIYALLKALVGNRVYPDVAPSGTAYPCIVYQQVGGSGNAYIEGTMPDRENCRMQIAVWGPTRSAVIALAKQVESAICQSELMARPLGARVSTYEDDTQLYGARQDFDCWPLR